MTKEERTRALRYKRPALASMSFYDIRQELDDIQEACYEVQYYIDNDDGTLLNALDDDEEQEWEFKTAFADLSAKADQLLTTIYDQAAWDDDFEQMFNDCTVALIGNRYSLVGYDTMEEDYFALASYDRDLACTEAGKRVMRHTKAEILSTIGQCLGILLAYLDLRQSYDYLKATMDILRDENTSLLRTIKEIDNAYDRAAEANFRPWSPATKAFDQLLDCLPQRAWLE